MIFVFTGPTGCGKTTVVHKVRQAIHLPVHVARSCTTRTQGLGEINGDHYHFISNEAFVRMIADKQFLEHAIVHGNRYGTLISEVENHQHVFLEIDIQGARQIREKKPNSYRIFILPPSRTEAERRLRSRQRDSEEEIQRRLVVAAQEIAQASKFNAWVVNDDLEQTVKKLAMLVSYFALGGSPAALGRSYRDEKLLERVSSTFFAQPA